MERHQIGAALFAKVGELLQANGLKLSGGTIVDATLIAAPPSTKNEQQSRDPEMHQSKKGKQWHFGMKVHIGVDSQSGLIHSASVTWATPTTARSCPTCCTDRRPGSTGTAPTGARSGASGSKSSPPRPKTSPTSALTSIGR